MPEAFKIKLETKELSQYLEAFSEDQRKVMIQVIATLDRINKLDLKLNKKEKKLVVKMSSAMDRLSKKKFKVEDHTNFKSLESQVRALVVAIGGLKIPKKLEFKQPTMPKQKVIANLPPETMDGVKELLMALHTSGLERKSVRVENFGDMEIVYPKGGSTSGKQDQMISLLTLIETAVSDDKITKVRVDSGDTKIEYVGRAEAGSLTSQAVWKLFRIDDTTGTDKLYAGGSTEFDQIFDERESLTYS